MDFRKLKDRCITMLLVKRLKELKPDNYISNSTTIYLTQFENFIEALHIFHFESGNLSDWQDEYIERFIQKFRWINLICHFVKDVMEKHKLNRSKLKTIYNGVDNNLLKNRNKNYIKNLKGCSISRR